MTKRYQEKVDGQARGVITTPVNILARVESVEITMREVGRFMDSMSAATSSLMAFRFGRPPASDASVVDVGLPAVAVDPGVPGPPAVVGVVNFF
jgi:hypothetical protein